MAAPSPAAARAGLVVATLAVSASAVFIRLARTDSVTVVWLRMALAVALLLPWVIIDLRNSPLRLDRRHRWLLLSAGVFLAVHFLAWTASVAYTSVASSVLLVSLHPVLVAPLGARFFGERLRHSAVAGIALALAGTAITCGGDLRVAGGALKGDLLALTGAVALVGYLLVGRRMRGVLGVATYSASAYAVVAISGLVVATVGGNLHLPSSRGLLACAALAIVCTIAGHTVYTWTLRTASATMVSVAFLGEAPLAAGLALLVLSEVPAATTLLGAPLILLGIALTLGRGSGVAERVAEVG